VRHNSTTDLTVEALPGTLFREMEANVEGSFLEMEEWRELRERQ